MSHTLIIDTGSTSLSSAVVVDEKTYTSRIPVFPLVVNTTTLDLTIKFANRNLNGFEIWSGTAGNDLEFLAGPLNAPPTAGTFVITFDGQTTTPLAYDASDADVKTALEALSNITPGDITVTKLADSHYDVQFGGSLAGTDVALMTVNAAMLNPRSKAHVTEIRPGAAGIEELQKIRILQDFVASQVTWTEVQNGWQGVVSFDKPQVIEQLGNANVKRLTYEVRVKLSTDSLWRVYAQGPIDIGPAINQDTA